MSHYVQGLHWRTCRWYKMAIPCLSTCMYDNPLDKACGLYQSTGWHDYVYELWKGTIPPTRLYHTSPSPSRPHKNIIFHKGSPFDVDRNFIYRYIFFQFHFLIIDLFDSGVASLTPARPHTFGENDHGIISLAILLSSAESRRVFKYVHEVLVNRLVKLAQEKSVVYMFCASKSCLWG